MVGKMSIQNVEDCKNAVDFVRSIIPSVPKNVVIQIEHRTNYPKGCYVYDHEDNDDGEETMYFNTHPTGNRDVFSRQVCIAAGM